MVGIHVLKIKGSKMYTRARKDGSLLTGMGCLCRNSILVNTMIHLIFLYGLPIRMYTYM